MTRLPSEAPEVTVAELRTIAQAVALLQAADALSIHAVRDMCGRCLLTVMQSKVRGGLLIPFRYLGDPEWMHRHVTAPGTRIAARFMDDPVDHA